MSFDAWQHLCYTNSWIMTNMPPIQDNHHFNLQIEQEIEYQEDLAFFEIQDTTIEELNDNNYYGDDVFEDDEDYEPDDTSSSDSEEEFEYVK